MSLAPGGDRILVGCAGRLRVRDGGFAVSRARLEGLWIASLWIALVGCAHRQRRRVITLAVHRRTRDGATRLIHPRLRRSCA